MGQIKISNYTLSLILSYRNAIRNIATAFSNIPNEEPLGGNEEFESGASGASDTFPMQCSALRKNGHVMIKSRPCKIVEMSTSKTCKHGHAKVHLVALDIFTGRKYEDICPSTHNMMVPHVTRQDYQVTNIDDGYVDLMDDNGETKSDLKIPDDETGSEVLETFENGDSFSVTVLSAIGEEKIVGLKTLT